MVKQESHHLEWYQWEPQPKSEMMFIAVKVYTLPFKTTLIRGMISQKLCEKP